MAPVIDIFPDGEWIDITSDVRVEAGLQEGRGRQVATDTTSSSLSAVLENAGGTYSSDVPGTPYYRTLGRGTHIRVRDVLVQDRFTRTTASSWGSTPDLVDDKPNPVLAWSNGSGSASDYSTTGTVGRHTITTTNVARQSRLDLILRPVMVRTSVTIGALATGASARAAVVVRKTTSGTAHYRAELEYTTSGTVIPRISRLGGPGSATLATGTTGAYSAGQKWWIVCMAVGSELYMRAWADGSTEPTTWLEAEDVHLRRGQVALRSFRDTGNTNASLTVDFHDLEISHPDFYGEIWSMRPMNAQGGRDLTMTVQAGGILQRLSNTDKPARSSLYTSMSTGSFFNLPPVGYWPLEDGPRAQQLEHVGARARPGSFTGQVQMGSDSSLAGSAPLPVVTGSGLLSGRVPAFTGFDASTDVWSVLWLMKIDDPPDVETVLVRFATPSPAAAYEVAMSPAGELIFRGPKLWQTSVPTYVFSVSELYDDQHLSGFTTSPSIWGQWVSVLLGNEPGSDSVLLTWTHVSGEYAGPLLSYSDAALVWREPNGAWTMGAPQSGSVGYGHVGVYDDIFFFTDEASGFMGERARTRFSRIAALAGIPVQTVGTQSEPMGPRLLGTTVENLEDSVAADWGIMSEPRHQIGLQYKARQHLYNQAPAMTIDCSDKQLNDGLSPIRDDARGLVTEVTATRPGGSPETFAVLDGDVHHLTSEDAPAGIGGVIQGTLSPNVETDRHAHQQAAWTVHLGASREPRYEQIKLLLHSPTYANDVQRYADATAVSEGEVIRLVNTPAPIAATIPPGAIDLMVQGIERHRDGVTDELVWNCTPAPPWEVWGLDASNSRLDLAADDDETSLKVSVEVGPGWKTNPDPGWYLQGMTGGEAMLVTGCTTDTPTFIAAGTVATGDNASVVPGLPAGMTPDTGQLMLLFAAIRNSGTGTPSTPSGWDLIAGYTPHRNIAVYGRYYVTGDTAPTVSFTAGVAGADTMARIFGFSGVSRRYGGASSPLKAAKRTPGIASQLNSSAQNINYPAYYVHRDNSVAMIFAWKQDDWTGVAPPAGFTEMADNATTTGDDSGIAAYYQIQTTATDVASGSLVVTGGASAASRAIVVALRPLQTLVVERAVNGVTGSLVYDESIHVWRHGAVPL